MTLTSNGADLPQPTYGALLYVRFRALPVALTTLTLAG